MIIQKNTSTIEDHVLIKIHDSIHAGHGVIINNQFYDINTENNGCKYIDFDNYRFIEQNKNKFSFYAIKVQNNSKIT